MAPNTRVYGGPGTQVCAGENLSIVTLNESTQLSSRPGRLIKVRWVTAGTSWVVTVYDDPSANNNAVYTETSVTAQTIRELGYPMSQGVRVVTSGTTPGEVHIVWS